MELDSGERGGGYADGVLTAAVGSADQQPVGERAVECRIGHEGRVSAGGGGEDGEGCDGRRHGGDRELGWTSRGW
ncbi:hypothetical protein HPP92_017548 [Vanilla planifolia]|uniref:Uncharacterized protein n=1 Tax=Vanilla planifolia TaxID=51239 RepID=A0A835UPR2_VANPL|nr:hypothetical protein HPP92_018164 [Vanilla planifolia]KAG0468220.1 hypothetical protein HPP92_017548 [Vanilla planifolia]